MKHRIAKLTALAATLALAAWAAIALAAPFGGSGPGGLGLVLDGGSYNSNSLVSGTNVNGVQTVNSAAYVNAMNISVPQGGTIYVRASMACTALVAVSGGSVGDWAAEEVDFAAVNVGGSLAIAGGPTVIGTPYKASSMMNCAMATTTSGTNAIIEVGTESTGTIDCNVRAEWVQVN